MNNEKTTSGGIGFGSALLLTFIILKLVGVIDWSWWWVLSPIWIPVVLLLAVSILLFVVLKLQNRKIFPSKERSQKFLLNNIKQK